MQPGRRVNGFARNPYLEVEMRAGRLAGRTDRADGLTSLDALTGRDVHGRKMPISGGVPAAVVDEDVVAVAAVPLGHDNGARSGRGHRRAGGGRDVEPLVELRAAAERVRAPAEG